jgi:hypothetical protein
MIKLGEVPLYLGIYLALEAIGILYMAVFQFSRSLVIVAALTAVTSGALLWVYRKNH